MAVFTDIDLLDLFSYKPPTPEKLPRFKALTEAEEEVLDNMEEILEGLRFEADPPDVFKALTEALMRYASAINTATDFDGGEPLFVLGAETYTRKAVDHVLEARMCFNQVILLHANKTDRDLVTITRCKEMGYTALKRAAFLAAATVALYRG